MREWQIASDTRQFVTASTDGEAALKRTHPCNACSTGSLSGTFVVDTATGASANGP